MKVRTTQGVGRLLGVLGLTVLIGGAQPVAQAADLNALAALFASRWHSGYEPGRCGVNSMKLLDAAGEAGIDLRGVSLVMLQDRGFSNFGMVQALFAREDGPRNTPGLRNWFQHVFLEADGYVLDFDYGNEPRVEPASAYFPRMYFEAQPGETGVSAQKKLRDYWVTLTPAEEYFRTRGRRRDVPLPQNREMRLSDYLGPPAGR
jgi:hypothetical protein